MDGDGPLAERQHPKRILSLDGGGVRGIVSLAFLERLEALMAAAEGRPDFRLRERFDLIGGTSTGSLIAAGLAIGLSVAEVMEHYFRLAPRVFRRRWYRLAGLQSLFDARHLKQEIERIAGGATLDDPAIGTGLAILTKRMDSGAVWVVTNCPGAKYWNDPPDGHYIGNRHYRLADIVRASTAAPYYFEPERIRLFKSEPPGLFIDGSVTPHNNPTLALLMAATIPAFGWGWPTGEDRLQIVSVGTGSFRVRMDRTARRKSAVGLAIQALQGVIADAQGHTLALSQWLGRSETPWTINSEIGDLADAPKPGPALFRLWRFDLKLEAEWLEAELGRDIDPETLALLRRMDYPATMELALELARAAAARQIDEATVAAMLR